MNPFTLVSKNGTAMVVLALAYILPFLGVVDVQESEIGAFVDNAMKVISFVLMVWSQIERPDLSFGVIRK